MADTADADASAGGFPSGYRVTMHSPNLDGLLVVIIQHWRWIVLTPLLFGIAVLLALPFLTASYEITASVLLKLGREQSAPPVAGSPLQSTPFKRAEDVTSEIEILKSQALLEQLVTSFGVDYFFTRKPAETFFQQVKENVRSAALLLRDAWNEVLIRLGLEKRLTRFEQVVSTLQASIHVEAVKRADVMDVSLLSADPAGGIEVLSRLLQLYQAEHIRVFKTPGATEFLAERVAALKGELQDLESRRREFGAHEAVWDLEEQRKLLLQQQQSTRLAISHNQEERSRLVSEIAQAASVLKEPADEIRTARTEQSNPAAQSLQARIVERRAALAKLRLSYADNSERVKNEEAEIASLEELLGRTDKLLTQSETFETKLSRRDLERSQGERLNRLPGLEALLAEQLQDLKRVSEELKQLDTLGEQSRRLQRETGLVEQSYQLFAQRLDEARISEALDDARISNVAVIGQPTSSLRPVRPKPMLLFLGALAAGLIGTIGLYLLRDVLRPVVHSRERAIALLGVPVLGRLPEVRH